MPKCSKPRKQMQDFSKPVSIAFLQEKTKKILKRWRLKHL